MVGRLPLSPGLLGKCSLISGIGKARKMIRGAHERNMNKRKPVCVGSGTQAGYGSGDTILFALPPLQPSEHLKTPPWWPTLGIFSVAVRSSQPWVQVCSRTVSCHPPVGLEVHQHAWPGLAVCLCEALHCNTAPG